SDVNRDLPIPEIRSQIAQMEETSARERVFTRLLIVFGSFALLLASIGPHGVTAYSVARRTSEIGVRVAVGARPDQVLWLMLRQVLLLAGAGLAIGIPIAIAAGPIVASLLYEVAPNDIAVIGAAAALMLSVALTAGFWPALRAARLDALVALNSE
ncbi:MAG: FtsX-like permease family protein, partial [Gemmatimonadota bacterium]